MDGWTERDRPTDKQTARQLVTVQSYKCKFRIQCTYTVCVWNTDTLKFTNGQGAILERAVIVYSHR